MSLYPYATGAYPYATGYPYAGSLYPYGAAAAPLTVAGDIARSRLVEADIAASRVGYHATVAADLAASRASLAATDLAYRSRVYDPLAYGAPLPPAGAYAGAYPYAGALSPYAAPYAGALGPYAAPYAGALGYPYGGVVDEVTTTRRRSL
eukprot:NODE_3296_length_573_cov_5110.177481_g2776_i0.p1 GENE.NODE_3296_length_573_cov_5110.177481_g2776_i0~~NODE_3296_length_573_cov_5110.177481_g2776_i0.p1  ORF type:complete len:170 (-),score=47.64 NODE_3296_length_573_cov_5110.177481_g2776_i0:63-512(-)